MCKKQLTLMFHINDLPLAHLSPKVVTNCIMKFNMAHDNMDPSSFARGKLYNYLLKFFMHRNNANLDASIIGKQLKTMIGYFELDPNRVIDVILEIIEHNIASASTIQHINILITVLKSDFPTQSSCALVEP